MKHDKNNGNTCIVKVTLGSIGAYTVVFSVFNSLLKPHEGTNIEREQQ